MRSVEVIFKSTNSDLKTEPFSVTLEAQNGDRWDLKARNRDVIAGEDGSKTYMLEPGERLIIEPSNAEPKMVFDKEQNANVRVEDEAEREEREEREAKAAQHVAGQRVEAAQAKVLEAKQSAENAEGNANKEVKKAEADKAAVEADQAKNRAAASEQLPASGVLGQPPQKLAPNTSVGAPVTNAPLPGGVPPRPPGNPASANTGPIDSKQVKAEGNTPPSQPPQSSTR